MNINDMGPDELRLAVQELKRYPAEVERLTAILQAAVKVVATNELPDGDPLDCSVPTLLWLEQLAAAAAKG